MGMSHDLTPHGANGVVGSERLPPEGGFQLYRYKNAADIETKGWHSYYFARRTEQGDYEILSVPSSLGERPVPGGVFPKETFEKLYEKIVP